MKIFACSSFLICLIFFANAQRISSTKYNRKDSLKIMNLILGGSYTYVWDTEVVNGIDYNTNYNENTFNINLATDISRRFRIGVDYKKIYSNGKISGGNKYFLLGLFQQYKFLRTKKGFGFGELGFYKGNYCTCGDDVPFKTNNISYINWGGGFNTKLYRNLNLDIAFTTAQVVSKIPGRYGFTQYILGLDYEFEFSKKRK